MCIKGSTLHWFIFYFYCDSIIPQGEQSFDEWCITPITLLDSMLACTAIGRFCCLCEHNFGDCSCIECGFPWFLCYYFFIIIKLRLRCNNCSCAVSNFAHGFNINYYNEWTLSCFQVFEEEYSVLFLNQGGALVAIRHTPLPIRHIW